MDRNLSGEIKTAENRLLLVWKEWHRKENYLGGIRVWFFCLCRWICPDYALWHMEQLKSPEISLLCPFNFLRIFIHMHVWSNNSCSPFHVTFHSHYSELLILYLNKPVFIFWLWFSYFYSVIKFTFYFSTPLNFSISCCSLFF